MLSVKQRPCIRLSPPSLEAEPLRHSALLLLSISLLRQGSYWITQSAHSDDRLKALKDLKNLHVLLLSLVNGPSIHPDINVYIIY